MIRIGIIGTGYIARRAHLSNFVGMDGVAVTALYNRTRSRAEAVNGELLNGQAQIHDNWESLVTAPDIDAVSICTTADMHAAPAIAALQAGKHVLCEKPVAASLADAVAILAATEAAPEQVFMVDHGMRFTPQCVLAKSIIESGEYGPVHAVRAFVGHGGGEKRGDAISDWYGDDRRGGNVLVDLGVHELDLLRWFVGSEPMEVTASGTTRKPEYHRDAYDNVAMTIRFANDVVTSLHASWTFKPGFVRDIAVAMERAWLAVRGGKVVLCDVESGKEQLPALPDIPVHGGDKLHFIRCIQRGETPSVTAHDGLVAAKMALAGIEAARTRQTVSV